MSGQWYKGVLCSPAAYQRGLTHWAHWLMLKGLGELKAVCYKQSLWPPMLLDSHTPGADLLMGNWHSVTTEIWDTFVPCNYGRDFLLQTLLFAFWTYLVLAPMLSAPVEFHTLILRGRKRSIFSHLNKAFCLIFLVILTSFLYFFRHYSFFFQNTFWCTVLSRAFRTVKYTLSITSPLQTWILTISKNLRCAHAFPVYWIYLFFFFLVGWI